MKKITLGDIFEIITPKGRAYIHYIYQDQSIGAMIRVLQGLYSERPIDFEQIVNSKERYIISFPLLTANKRKIVERVGYYAMSSFIKPDYMRTEHTIRGEFLGWHIIDTVTWQRKLVKNLSLAEKELSPWGAWNDTLLIERLVDDWSLGNWI